VEGGCPPVCVCVPKIPYELKRGGAVLKLAVPRGTPKKRNTTQKETSYGTSETQ
jgi:hypothetical protein